MKVLRVPLFTRMRAMGTAPGRAVRLGEAPQRGPSPARETEA